MIKIASDYKRTVWSLIAGWFACGHMLAAPLPVGSGQIQLGSGADALTIYTYKPTNYQGGPLLVVFHGMLRNAEGYRDSAIPVAEKFNFLVAAPLFETNRFNTDAYNRGGVVKKGEFQPPDKWTYNYVPKIIAEMRKRESAPNLPYYFMGHSGGGQFLMRLAAFSPLEAKRIVAANPGSDLFPRRDWKFGYGFGGLPKAYSDDKALRAYLAAPLTIYLGTADNDPNHFELDRSPAAMLEGSFRLERGRACFEYAQKLAKEHGWTFNWRKVETVGIAHEAKGMFAAPEVEQALFGATKTSGGAGK